MSFCSEAHSMSFCSEVHNNFCEAHSMSFVSSTGGTKSGTLQPGGSSHAIHLLRRGGVAFMNVVPMISSASRNKKLYDTISARDLIYPNACFVARSLMNDSLNVFTFDNILSMFLIRLSFSFISFLRALRTSVSLFAL